MNNESCCCGRMYTGERPCIGCPSAYGGAKAPNPLTVEHPPARLYFECHVTLDPVPEPERERVETIAARHGFRLAKLLMQKGEPSNLDTFMTARGDSYLELVTRMTGVIRDLRVIGCPLRRAKIEDTLYDTKRGDVWPL